MDKLNHVTTYVFLEGQVIAGQQVNLSSQSESIEWKKRDPLATSVYSNGQQLALDPNGISTDNPNPSNLSQYPSYYSQMYNSSNYGYSSYNPGQGSGSTSGSPYGYGGGIGGTPGDPQVCNVEGGNIPCDQVTSHMAAQCPNNDCGPKHLTVNVPYSPDPNYKPTKSGFFSFTAYANGTIGYKGTLKTEFFARENDGSLISGGHAVWYNEIFLEFSSMGSYWLFRENHPVPNGETGGQLIIDGGRGNPSGSDPCAGRKGPLNFSPENQRWGMDNHIFPRHIATSTERDKSKYVFFPWQMTAAQYKNRVKSLDQLTFENGKFAEVGASAVYTYAFVGIEVGDDNYIANQVGVVGKGLPHEGAKTNVNTLVVSTNDCASVITSYAGLPRQFNESDIPRAMFRTDGWSFMHRAFNF